MGILQARQNRRRMGKVKDGDGSAMKPYRFWQFLYRTIFHINIENQYGDSDRYTVDIDLYGPDLLQGRANLFKNNKEIAKSTIPAQFPIGDGYIDVQATDYGLKRIHYVEGNMERQLTPDPRTAEGFRANLAFRHPKLSRTIDILSITILVIGILVLIPSLIETISGWEITGGFEFTSPLHLPGWFEGMMLVLTILAAIERALSIKNHWLIDMDTSYLDQ